jgi:hypothetical protein
MKAAKILHYLALILGFQASAFFLFFLIAEGGSNLFEGKYRVIPILVLMIVSVAGYILAISKPKPGSVIMILGGLAMAFYLLVIGGVNETVMALAFGLPFIIPGIIVYLTGDIAITTTRPQAKA